MIKDPTPDEIEYRLLHNQKIKLVGGPWDGKEIADMEPDNREIHVWPNNYRHIYIKSGTNRVAYHDPSRTLKGDFKIAKRFLN